MKVNIRANRWLGVSLIFWASFWFEELWYNIVGVKVELNNFLVVNFLQFLTPIAFFVSVSYFTNSSYSLSKNVGKYMIIPAFYLTLLFLNRELDDKYQFVQLLFVLGHAIFYLGYSLLRIHQHQKGIEQFASSTQEINLRWLVYIIIATLFMTFAVAVFNLLFYELPLNLFMNATVLGVVFFIVYNSLKQHQIFPKNKATADVNEQEPKKQLMEEDRLDEIKGRLEGLMSEQKPYLDSDLNLVKLADMLEITSHQLSHVINKGYNENFFQFVNKFRVEKAKVMLIDSQNDKLSILGVAFESGFSSKTSFNTTFKKMTGQTPSEYKKAGSTL
ncbi:AraC family transcriptional regulator [Carboxylicivirga sediminis]|uniref:AraC family transcriptional regulator n=1 Tax=Carboxylicivirga sediminis TaxID=2006564 RepID=A0A941IY83_9BACT|nr:helix-turn-helix domain-containing protein [Carboxylicivirga sediminis]MBR8537616.1 AraC family transcriptional regulator [Carboxylicivirga sediminis]